MEENLDTALANVLAGEISPKEIAAPIILDTQDLHTLAVLALEHYNKAKDYLRRGNWADYGRELDQLEKILKEISGIEKERK